MFVNWLTDQQNIIHTREYYSVMKRGKKLIMEETQKHAKWKKSEMKEYILYNSIHMKISEKANL